ncbi:hypothetical protein [uncultured Fusobacterium sp.]|uniref:hypothetical protein n=1 Tax=uncultured Fusobacterium sp. TaxID=159267 RepID=UPI0027DCE5F9|nr:hypothetical protein [uncultured Fusobacterium sp.]
MEKEKHIITITGGNNIVNSDYSTQNITIKENKQEEIEAINSFIKVLEKEFNNLQENSEKTDELIRNVEILKSILNSKDDTVKQTIHILLTTIGKSIDLIPKAVGAYISLKIIFPMLP